MRLAYVCLDPGVPVFGCKGCSVHAQEVIREFRKRGWEVELFAARLGRETPKDLQDIRSTRLAKNLPKEALAREQSLVGLNAVVEKALQDSKPFDLVYERYSLWSYSAMQFADKRKIPGVLEVNSPLIEEQKTYRTLHDEATAKRLSEECFRYATSIITVSQAVADKTSNGSSIENKIRVVPNGVNCERFQVQPAKDNDSPVIGFVGTLKPWHGIGILLDAYQIAFAANPNIKLKIVGSGPEEGALRAKLATFAEEVQSSVQWLGSLDNADMPEALSTIDIAVAPYPELNDFYFSPLKILEYMAAGKAIVASRIGQIPELLPADTAVLVQPGNANELASALIQLANDSAMRKQLGKSAKQKAIAEHSWSAVVSRILSSVPTIEAHCEAI